MSESVSDHGGEPAHNCTPRRSFAAAAFFDVLHTAQALAGRAAVGEVGAVAKVELRVGHAAVGTPDVYFSL